MDTIVHVLPELDEDGVLPVRPMHVYRPGSIRPPSASLDTFARQKSLLAACSNCAALRDEIERKTRAESIARAAQAEAQAEVQTLRGELKALLDEAAVHAAAEAEAQALRVELKDQVAAAALSAAQNELQVLRARLAHLLAAAEESQVFESAARAQAAASEAKINQLDEELARVVVERDDARADLDVLRAQLAHLETASWVDAETTIQAGLLAQTDSLDTPNMEKRTDADMSKQSACEQRACFNTEFWCGTDLPCLLQTSTTTEDVLFASDEGISLMDIDIADAAIELVNAAPISQATDEAVSVDAQTLDAFKETSVVVSESVAEETVRAASPTKESEESVHAASPTKESEDVNAASPTKESEEPVHAASPTKEPVHAASPSVRQAVASPVTTKHDSSSALAIAAADVLAHTELTLVKLTMHELKHFCDRLGVRYISPKATTARALLAAATKIAAQGARKPSN